MTVAQKEQTIRLRIVCVAPPDPAVHGAVFGLQDNSTTQEWVIHPGKVQSNGDIHFECTCRVRTNPRTNATSILGPFVHGGGPERFLYLSWRPKAWRPGQTDDAECPVWLRRMKVHLRSISQAQIEEALAFNGVLEATVEGTGKGGGPNCASVPLVGGGWRVRR